MAYTEIKERNGKKYYYRVKSMRDGKKFKKKRIYLGKDLSKEELALKEGNADNKLNLHKKEKKLKTMEKIIPKIKKILKKNKVVRAGIAGSYARGEQKGKSDIDILVEINDPKMSLLGFVGLKLDLEEALRKKVDLVEYKMIRSEIRDNILKDEVKII